MQPTQKTRLGLLGCSERARARGGGYAIARRVVLRILREVHSLALSVCPYVVSGSALPRSARDAITRQVPEGPAAQPAGRMEAAYGDAREI